MKNNEAYSHINKMIMKLNDEIIESVLEISGKPYGTFAGKELTTIN